MITHIVSDWLFSPCCVEHQEEFIFERVAVAYSRDYNEVGRAQIKQASCICENKDADQLCVNREADQRLCFCYTDSTIPLLSESKILICSCTARFVSDLVGNPEDQFSQIRGSNQCCYCVLVSDPKSSTTHFNSYRA